jgi:hypothetical protein
MYELKKNGKVYTSKFVGTGPSCYKKDFIGRGLTKVEKYCSRTNDCQAIVLITYRIALTGMTNIHNSRIIDSVVLITTF